jgi:transposase
MMPARVELRQVSDEEAEALRRLAGSRTAPAAVVQRARIIRALLAEPTLSAGAGARRVGFTREDVGPVWVRRFNAAGIAGLHDAPRSGRPATHTVEVHGQLIALAVQKPRTPGHPFALWTLQRLQRAFAAAHHVHLSDSTIWEWLKAKGLVWKRQQTWFHEPHRHDPAFVEKRGTSSRRTSPCRSAAASSASTSSARSR